MTAQTENNTNPSYLTGIRVLELADEQGEYAGKMLAGFGAEVLKVEPTNGNSTRAMGPFLNNEPDPDRSLYFWHYNFGKRGIALDLSTKSGKSRFVELAKQADLILETTPSDLSTNGFTYEALSRANPGLIWLRISPFGDNGPWADYKGSDLVHLALGGVMMNTGYDRDPATKQYDTPPIAPQMFQAYHIASQHAVMAAMGAIMYKHATGRGQYICVPIHQAVSTNTETDTPQWVYLRQPIYRQTCRHAGARPSPPDLGITKDGRYVMTRNTQTVSGMFDKLSDFLRHFDAIDDLEDPKYKDDEHRNKPEVQRHINDISQRLVQGFKFEGPWHEAQASGLPWVPLRRPEEGLADSHWQARRTFQKVEHPELDKRFDYVGAPWVDANAPWRAGPRAPLLNESKANQSFVGESPLVLNDRRPKPTIIPGPLGKPFALNGIRVIDIARQLASSGARYIGALGAEILRVEWAGNLGIARHLTHAPTRQERDNATAPIPPPQTTSINRSGSFNDVHTGKRSFSLNMNHPRGKELFRELVKVSDVIVEGFSPQVMRRWGFHYEALNAINPRIVYVQQSGMGQQGTYGEYRATGPVAASLSGLSEMSGLPEPYMPAGIGYSYLDWFGAYNTATAMLAGLNYREISGKGTYIDASQTEAGIVLTGSAILNYSANGQAWHRYGNRSPWKPAAPCGAYRCAGDDRWIAITCHTQIEWLALGHALGAPSWASDDRFGTLEERLQHQDELDMLINETVKEHDAFNLMHELQRLAVPAGVCQTAEDRCDHDPQLKHLQWQRDLPSGEMGTWPIKEFPAHLSETPTYMGSTIDRASPLYAEDNDYVYGTVLGLSDEEIKSLRREDVI